MSEIRFNATPEEILRIGERLDMALDGEANPDACFVAVALLVANLFANIAPDLDDLLLARMVEMVKQKIPELRRIYELAYAHPQGTA